MKVVVFHTFQQHVQTGSGFAFLFPVTAPIL